MWQALREEGVGNKRGRACDSVFVMSQDIAMITGMFIPANKPVCLKENKHENSYELQVLRNSKIEQF